jgi:hypothetical protein
MVKLIFFCHRALFISLASAAAKYEQDRPRLEYFGCAP